MIYKIVFILLLIASVCLAKSIQSSKEESDLLARCMSIWSVTKCSFSTDCCSGGFCSHRRRCIPFPGK